MIEISDIRAPELRAFTGAAEDDLFIAESASVIERALDAGCRPVAFLGERGQAERIEGRADGAPVYVAPREVLTALTGYHLTRGLMCVLRRPEPLSVEFIAEARRIAFLEGVVDPSNVGAIFRSAAALGMDGIVLDPRCADPLYRKAARVSMGTVFALPWARGTISDLKTHGFYTVAMALTDASVSIADPALRDHERIAVALGNEGAGLSPQTVAACDAVARIPMYRGVDSLNVAAAAAVAFYALCK